MKFVRVIKIEILNVGYDVAIYSKVFRPVRRSVKSGH